MCIVISTTFICRFKSVRSCMSHAYFVTYFVTEKPIDLFQPATRVASLSMKMFMSDIPQCHYGKRT